MNCRKRPNADPPYDVKGSVQIHASRPANNGAPGRTIEFAGSGYHDHCVGTAPFSAGTRVQIAIPEQNIREIAD